MNVQYQELGGNWKFIVLMIALSVTLIIDTAIVKINDLIDKYIISIQSKVALFFGNSVICLVLQFFILKFILNSFGKDRSSKTQMIRPFYMISLTAFFILVTLVGFLVFQLYYNHYYQTWITMSIVTISYGASSALIVRLSLLFFYWYKSSHDLVVFLYVVSVSLIAFHLIITALYIDVKLINNRYLVGEFIGASGDSGGSHLFLGNLYRISSFISFFAIWLTTAILMNSYRERLVNSIRYWVILTLPLVYFLITYFYQFFLSNSLSSYFQNDPITVSILVSGFLSLSKPIGGAIFAIAFWNMSRVIAYERKMKMSMVIAGWGIFFLFSANQAASQIVIPYPPFGITTVTVLNVGAFLMLLGIFNSASLVSTNNSLRSFIHKSALKLLNPIGRAEMEKEIQKSVANIFADKEIIRISEQQSFEFDEKELKRYLSEVIKAKKENLS